jgi:hypothetical protein
MKQFSFCLKFSLLSALLFLCVNIHAQQTIQKSVHFKKNKFTLTDDAKLILNGIKDSLGDYVIDKIIIKGYTDSDADSAYNAKLSENRCQSVKNYLSAGGIDSTKFHVAAYGEEFPVAENSTENNKSRNRRVDIIVMKSFPVIVKKIPTLKDTCLKDTLVELPNGVMMLVNKCSYRANPNCMTVTIERKEEYDLKFSRFRKKMGFKKYHRKKNKRVTYYAHIVCQDTTCGGDGRKLFIPSYEVKEKKVTVLKYDSIQGEFVKQKEPKVKSVKKKSYAQLDLNCHPGAGGEFYIFCCGHHHNYGCDCSLSKIKFKDGIKIVKAEMFCGEDFSVSSDRSTLFFNPHFGIKKIVLVDGNDTTTLENIQVTALRHGLRRTKSCKRNKYFLLMKFRRKCAYRRKYKFSRPDLAFQHSKIWVTEVK